MRPHSARSAHRINTWTRQPLGRAFPAAPRFGILHAMTKPPARKQSSPKTALTSQRGAQPPRMRAKLRAAVNLIATKGKGIGEAAEAAGMNASALSRAINRPEIKAHIEEQKALYCLDADSLKGLAKAIAINTGIDLMQSAASEAVRARLVEFFAGDGRPGTQVNVAVNVDRGGYEFVKPGQRVVDIRPAIDSVSSGDDGQVIDLQANPPTVDE